MNIAVDIDDTLTNSFDYFIRFVAEFFGVSTEYCEKNGISYSTLPEEWKKNELSFSKAYFDRVVPATPFKEDAAKFVRKLREDGHRIIIITGRNDSMYTDPYSTTREELNNGNIAYDKLICTLDKATACADEKIDVLIDDSVSNCTAVSQRGIAVVLFTSKANRNVKAPFRRVDCWRELYALLNSPDLSDFLRKSSD